MDRKTQRQLAEMPVARNWRERQRIARTCDRLRAKKVRRKLDRIPTPF